MSLGYNPVPHTSYLINAFRASLQCPSGDLGHGLPTGVPQLYSLLRASHEAGRQLTSLVVGDVNWQFLRVVRKCKKAVKQSLRQVRVLDLSISTYNDFDKVRHDPKIQECRKCLANKALCDLIKATPDLEDLSIAYDLNAIAELKYVVGDHHWPKLRRVSFQRIAATHADFASFCTRHASTLKHMVLSAIRVLEQGEWPRTLETIQQILDLESADFRRYLTCADPPQSWLLSSSSIQGDSNENAQGNKTSAALSKYLVHGGSCPLLDQESHPNRALV